jgi:hypothetical protein
MVCSKRLYYISTQAARALYLEEMLKIIISPERSYRGHSEDMHLDLIVKKG